MTFPTPAAARLVGWLIVAALGMFAALAISTSLAPMRHVIVFPQQTRSNPAAKSGSDQSQFPRSAQPSSSVQSSQSSADSTVQQSGSTSPVTGTTDSGGAGAAGIADAGPGVVSSGQTLPQTGKCGPKPCGT